MGRVRGGRSKGRVRVRSRRSARLAAIDEGAPHEALGRVRQVSAPVDDARRLASQLEQARRELLGGRRRNYLTNVARAWIGVGVGVGLGSWLGLG